MGAVFLTLSLKRARPLSPLVGVSVRFVLSAVGGVIGGFVGAAGVPRKDIDAPEVAHPVDVEGATIVEIEVAGTVGRCHACIVPDRGGSVNPVKVKS